MSVFYFESDILISDDLRIDCEDDFTGKSMYCKCLYNSQQVIANWSISDDTYATINQNGKLDVKENVVSQPVTITCTYSNLSASKTITVTYDNQLTIECADIMTGTTGNAIARYNSTIVQPQWTITSGTDKATIQSNGEITIISDGSITIEAMYNNYTATKTVQLVYQSNKSSQTIVEPDGSVTTETTTVVENPDGTTTKQSTATTVAEDGSISQTESTTVENQDGSSQTNSHTINQDGTSSQMDKTTNSDGSSTATTVSYDVNGDPTNKVNENTDVNQNVNTQDIEYDENGEEKVVGYVIDTSKNENGGETISGGLNTGFIAFDGRPFQIHFVAKLNPSSNSNKVMFAALQSTGVTSKPYAGFSVNLYGTSDIVSYTSTGSKITSASFGYRITGTVNGKNAQTLNYIKSGVQNITINVTYTPSTYSPQYKYIIYASQLYSSSTSSTKKSVVNSTLNSNSGYIPQTLDNATIHIGSYGEKHVHDAVDLEVLEFNVKKL